MMNNGIAIIGDIHLGVRNDARVFHSMMTEFFTGLIDTLLEKQIKNVIFLGDLFERRKFINFESLYVFKRNILDRFLENDIQIYTIAGNHDVYFKNTNRINSLELLLSEKEYPNIHHVVHDAQELEIDSMKFLFVPWVNKENYDSITNKIEKSESPYMVAHLDMAGFEMHRGAISDRGHFEAEFLEKFQKVITGHYHTKSSRGNIFYLGTPYQTSWNDFDEEKGWHIIYNDGSLDFISNSTQMFHKFIFDERMDMKQLAKEIKDANLTDRYVRLVVRTKKNPKLLEKVVEAIEKKLPCDLNVIDESVMLNDIDDSEIESVSDTLGVIRTFVMKDLETDLDKERLFTNMAVLYQQAQEMDDGE